MPSANIIRVVLIVFGLLNTSIQVMSQEFRGSITGQVTEASGALVANAQIRITNNANGSSTTAITNDSGNYSLLYLTPGQYTITVEATGFKKIVQQNIEVRVGDKLTLNLSLEIGGVSDTITVTDEGSVLDTSSVGAGQVIDRRRISELPLSDGNPFVLSRLASGVAYTGDLKFSRPFDNNGTSSIVANGGTGGNEFTLDGVPNNDNRRVAFVPPADAVKEFKVETSAFDAQQAHTSGAVINVMLKDGENQPHGTLYEFIRNDKLSGNDYFLNQAGQPRASLRYNRYGGTFGGPIFFPKKIFGPFGYDGRNRSFFFFAFEGLKDKFPEPNKYTVPTEAERNGDFSALLSLPDPIKIYDPLTAVKDGKRIKRTQFLNNKIPSDRISEVAKAYINFFPLPNIAGDLDGSDNYISANPRSDDFDSEIFRFDQNVSDKQKFFFRYSRNSRIELRNNWTGVVNGIRPTGNFLSRINHGFSYDHLYTLSTQTVLNFRLGYSRFNEPNVRAHEGQIDPKSLGFFPDTVALFNDFRYLPRVSFASESFSALGDSLGGNRNYNAYSFQPVVTHTMGNHSFRSGYDFRLYRENASGPGNAAGSYDFKQNYTKGPLDNSPSGAIGQDFASFLLGIPTGGSLDRNTARSNQATYHGVFIQDDWKITRKLTLNLGVRYELEGATTERFNRNVTGFDTISISPIEAAARKAYAAKPDPELLKLISPDNFKVKGGLIFADDTYRGFGRTDKNNVEPRIGLAFQISPSIVLRGGWGIYTVPYNIDGVIQYGFSQDTKIISTRDSGLSFAPKCVSCGNFFNPFPQGAGIPSGSSLGIATYMGRSLDDDAIPTSDRRNGQAQRWQFGIQWELPARWLIEANYIGNRSYDLPTSTDILNAVPRQFLSTKPVRDQQTIDFLTAKVDNPFKGLLPGTDFDGDTIDRQQLLRPFPQFGTIRTARYDGSGIYHSGQLRAERRLRGYTFSAGYTWSKYLEKVSFLNASDTKYEKRISRDDLSHRLVMSGIWEIPFGKGRKFGNNWNKVINGVFGGWQAQGIVQLQSGRPIDLGGRNLAFFDDPSKLRLNQTGGVFDPSSPEKAFDTSMFFSPIKDATKLAQNIRTFPSRLPGFRSQRLQLWDLSVIKYFNVTEGLKLQLRGEFLNAFNHPQFGDPQTDPTKTNFGKITDQTNLPRNIQIGLKLIF